MGPDQNSPHTQPPGAAGQQQWNQPPAAPPASGKAVAALILGIAGCCLIGILGAIPALILGIIAKKEIDESNGTIGGRGMAVAGIVLGIIGLVAGVFALIYIFVILGSFAQFLADFTEQYCEDNPDAEECQDAATHQPDPVWGPVPATTSWAPRPMLWGSTGIPVSI